MPNQGNAADIVMKSGESVANGGNGGHVEVETSDQGRVIYATGLEALPGELTERYEAILDAYTAKFQDQIDLNVKMANEVAQLGTQVSTELGEPITGRGYKWWDIFVVGPIQNIAQPPFLPHKIIAGGELAFFLVFVVKNPLPTPGGGPSALTLLNCRKFNLNAELVNLTKVTDGPDMQIRTEFNHRVIQPFLFVFRAPTPRDGKPDLYEINVTADVTDCPQPFAAFATRIFDIDNDPDGLPFPLDRRKRPHVHDEQPMRFLVYNAGKKRYY